MGGALSDLRALLRTRDPLNRPAAAVATGVITLGAAVLMGWAFDLPPLKHLHSSFATMKANTALSFIILGAGLRTLDGDERLQTVRHWLALAVMLLGGATLFEYAAGVDLGIDQALIRDIGGGAHLPGRMAHATAVNFVLLGFALFCWRVNGTAPFVARLAVVAVALLSFVALVGYVFGVASLYRIGPYSSIAAHTVLGFLAASSVFFMTQPAFRLMSIVTSKSAAGLLLRRVLPAVALVPIGLGWLRLLGERYGLYDSTFGAAIVTVGDVVLLGGVVLAVASRFHEADERFRLAIEVAPSGKLILERTGKIVLVNAAVERMFGYERSELIGQSLEKLIPTALREGHWGFLGAPPARALPTGVEQHGVRSDGSEVPIEVGMSPLEAGTELILASVVDITDRKRAEREHDELMEQRKATALLRERGRFFELSIDMVCVANAKGYFEHLNPAFTEVLGYALEELQQKPYLAFVHSDDRAATLREMQRLNAGIPTLAFTNRYRCKDGGYRWLQWRAAPESDGTLYAVARDVTPDLELVAELRAKQASLSQSLREREVLLQEVHHRVKNNLQIISSLISIQARQIDDAAARAALTDCKARVQTIAMIHEGLYQAKDFADVPFSRYARTLAQNIFHASGTPSSRVALELEIEDVALSVDRAIPCGLILNELITNALKHAYPDGRGGVLRVALRKSQEEITLTVSDDGVGIRTGFEVLTPGTSGSLGMQLVTTLTEQLEGRLELEHNKGTTFRVTFPAKAER